MSSKHGLNNLDAFQQILTAVLMVISFLAIFYSDIDAKYKRGIAALVFAIIFLTNIATQVLKQGTPQKNSN